MSRDTESDESTGELQTRLRTELDEALLALDELAQEDPEEALAMFDTLPEPVQALADFQLLLARAHQNLQQLDAARELLEEVLDKAPDSADAHHLLADVLEDLGHSDEANEHFLATRNLDQTAFQTVDAAERSAFTRLLAEVAVGLEGEVDEITKLRTTELPEKEEVLQGGDPRALCAFDPKTGSLSLFIANLFAEFGDLLGDPVLKPKLRRSLLVECAESAGWNRARLAQLGIDDSDR